MGSPGLFCPESVLFADTGWVVKIEELRWIESVSKAVNAFNDAGSLTDTLMHFSLALHRAEVARRYRRGNHVANADLI